MTLKQLAQNYFDSLGSKDVLVFKTINEHNEPVHGILFRFQDVKGRPRIACEIDNRNCLAIHPAYDDEYEFVAIEQYTAENDVFQKYGIVRYG